MHFTGVTYDAMAKESSNNVAEWFGHRVYPIVSSDPAALEDQQKFLCPLLSAANNSEVTCIKAKTSIGVCTVSSTSNGVRQDWLVCPHRALDRNMLLDVVSHLFGHDASNARAVLPASALRSLEAREILLSSVRDAGSAVLYFHEKLGGEISFQRTKKSPEMKLDVTIVSVVEKGGVLVVDRYGILELQTMEFHGSYRAVVSNLLDALRLFKVDFHEQVQIRQEWLGEKVEGPNIANVFKRTFYQMMFKFQIGAQKDCVGCVLAIPEAVWDSWQHHLGAPELTVQGGDYLLLEPHRGLPSQVPAWIYVYDLDYSNPVTPSPVRILKRIATTAESIGYYALEQAPKAAIAEGGSVSLLPYRIRERIQLLWPEFGRFEPAENSAE